MSDAVLANRVLETVANSLTLSVGYTSYHDFADGNDYSIILAHSADGMEQWTARSENFYEAVCGLAKLVGFELEYR